jgi:hypothetical protein
MHNIWIDMITEQELKELDEDTKWLHANYTDLLTRFNEEYIAIKNQQPLEHDKGLDRLRERLGQRHIDSSQLLIEYIRDKRNEIH